MFGRRHHSRGSAQPSQEQNEPTSISENLPSPRLPFQHMAPSASDTKETAGSSIRPGLGIASIVAALVAGWAYLVADDPTLGGLILRIGIILFAIWVAHPVLTAKSPVTWIVSGVGVLTILFRPRAALFVIPVLAVWLVTTGRKRR